MSISTNLIVVVGFLLLLVVFPSFSKRPYLTLASNALYLLYCFLLLIARHNKLF